MLHWGFDRGVREKMDHIEAKFGTKQNDILVGVYLELMGTYVKSLPATLEQAGPYAQPLRQCLLERREKIEQLHARLADRIEEISKSGNLVRDSLYEFNELGRCLVEIPLDLSLPRSIEGSPDEGPFKSRDE
jgi:hypothetical protein